MRSFESQPSRDLDRGAQPAAQLPGAVFLSLALQDAEAATQICDALRRAGIEVWLYTSELRGGDAWDRMIRRQIRDCALFIPVISQHTQERLEGYFRLEWKLAVERSHLMATERPFLVPVVIDATRSKDAIVPDEFRVVQWTRLPAGNTPPHFVERVQRLLLPVISTTTRMPAGADGVLPATREPIRVSRWSKLALFAIWAVLAVALSYVIAEKFWGSKHIRETAPALSASTTAASDTTAPFSPPPHSIAVLPFVNLSGDPRQRYFSDGLTEELLDSLTRINELQVAARTSSFSFEGEHPDIATVAHKLNVASVLEGSVRRSGNTIRVTAQLNDAVTGFHLWSQTYDRETGDILKLQSDIANAVAGALKVKLLGDVSARIELGGTHNPSAFDAYLRGAKARGAVSDAKEEQAAIAAYTEAIRLDPNYALAFAGRARAYSEYAAVYATGTAIREAFDKAHADAREATRLAPELAEGHMALGSFFELGSLDFTRAREAYERALALSPGSAAVLRVSSNFLANMGKFDEAIFAARRAVTLDPLNRNSHHNLGNVLYFARRYREAIQAYSESITLNPAFQEAYGNLGLAYYGLNDLENARSSCETKPDHWQCQQCLAVIYEKLGRHAEAEAVLAKYRAAVGDAASYQYATIYAQWGIRAKALRWLTTATRLRDPGLVYLKTDPLMDPLREEPRFQAIERQLEFPN